MEVLEAPVGSAVEILRLLNARVEGIHDEASLIRILSP